MFESVKHNGTYYFSDWKDKNGKAKKFWQDNFLARFFLKRNLWFPKIPFLFGRLSSLKIVPNLITSAGKAGAASRINGSGAEAAFTFLAVGTGSTAASVSDTTLQTEITDSGLARTAATASRVTTSVTNDTAQLVVAFSVSGSKTVTEAGIFNASSGGVLLSRQVFTGIPFVSGDTYTLTYKVQSS